jgi:predicted esterase
MTTPPSDPHRGQPIVAAGVSLADARAAAIMIHGRGASAQDILGLAAYLDSNDVAYLAPQAAGFTWYPHSFLNPLEDNQPYLDSALSLIGALLAEVVAAGLPPEKILLLGFSQGACLATEFVARNARRYGGLAVLSGGLIGPPETPRDYPGTLDGTPVFLGCGVPDPHIPKSRVEESAEALTSLGARVDLKFYPGMGHTVIDDELIAVREILAGL